MPPKPGALNAESPRQSWPLLLGVMLLMVGNGVQGSLLGIRGALEGFTHL